MDIRDIALAAREHAELLLNDIELCQTREEHIRLTARANEADRMATDLFEYVVSIEAYSKIG